MNIQEGGEVKNQRETKHFDEVETVNLGCE